MRYFVIKEPLEIQRW